MIREGIYKVVIVEDEAIILNNIIQKIEKTNPLFKVVGSAYDGKEAISLIDSLHPDALFTDIRMPIMDGLELIRQVKDRHPDMQIVILSGFDEFEYARQAIKLGVKSYLLKPLKLDALEETLRTISLKIQDKIQNTERTILSSGLTGFPLQAGLPNTFGNTNFVLFLISIGNLCSHIPSSEQLTFFIDAWERIQLTGILSDIFTENEKWWLVDEKHINQKFLIVSTDITPANSILTIASQIKERIFEKIYPIPVNICTEETTIPYTEIWTLAQKFRMAMKHGLVIGKSQLLTPKTVENANLSFVSLDSGSQNKFLTIIQSGNKQLIMQELSSLFNKCQESQYTQQRIEEVLHQLLNLIKRQIISLSEAELNYIEYNLYEKIAISSDLNPVIDKLFLFIDTMMSVDKNETDDTLDVLKKIDEYIRANYTQQISIEELSRKFNFNPSYLTRVFKKYKGETPLKLLITLRIDEAKRLIENQIDLDIREIGEIIGYSDQHYFCRIFKNVTGMSPSEYRESAVK